MPTTTTAAAAAPAPNVLVALEQKVETFIQEVVQGVEHELSVIGQALSSVFQLLPAATAKIEALVPFVESMAGAAGQPAVVAGVAAADVAMKGLDQFMATWTQATSGGGVNATVAKQAISQAYTAYRNVGAAYNSVKAAAVQAATTPAQPAPTVTAAPTPAS